MKENKQHSQPTRRPKFRAFSSDLLRRRTRESTLIQGMCKTRTRNNKVPQSASNMSIKATHVLPTQSHIALRICEQLRHKEARWFLNRLKKSLWLSTGTKDAMLAIGSSASAIRAPSIPQRHSRSSRQHRTKLPAKGDGPQ